MKRSELCDRNTSSAAQFLFAAALGLFACEGTIGERAVKVDDRRAGPVSPRSDGGGVLDIGAPAPRRDVGPADLGMESGAEDAGISDMADAGADGRVPVFVAQGHMGRTTVSCDLGRSWTADRSNADGPVCESMDCDHDPGAGRGVAFGDGWFFATFGWGPAGQVVRSRDGVDWEPVSEETTYAGLAVGKGTVLGGGKWGARYSIDSGQTWESAGVGRTLRVPNARSTHFLDLNGGLFIIAGSKSGENDLVLSADAQSWWNPDSLPAECGGGTFTGGGIELVGDEIVAVGGGTACWSGDGGRTFTSTTIDPEVSRWRSELASDGQQLSVWAAGRRYASRDAGRSWSSTLVQPDDLNPRAVAYGAGVYVAVVGRYDDQVFYWSEDGVRWTQAEAQGSHRILHIAVGRIDPGYACP